MDLHRILLLRVELHLSRPIELVRTHHGTLGFDHNDLHLQGRVKEHDQEDEVMDEDIIDCIADTLAEQISKAADSSETAYWAVVDDIQAMACVVNQYEPTYDLRYFYRRANHPTPYPVHPVI